MPQFDPTFWVPQLIWLGIIFVAMYFLMARVALPRVSAVLEEREFRINDSLRKAEALKHEAESAVAAYDKMMADARTKAQAAVTAVRERAAQEAAERNSELDTRLAAQVSDAEKRIDAAKERALAGIRDVAVAATSASVERLLGRKPAATVVGRAVNEVLKEKS
jgi:F-type H+-transporting ATPase subunit b